MNTVANQIGTHPVLTHTAHPALAVQPKSARSRRGLAIISLIGGVALGLASSPLHAGEPSAMAGESIHLGHIHGVYYYTSESDGFRVVATVADGEAGAPVRLSATLAEGQSATISVPSALGEPDRSLEMSRTGGKLTVSEVGSVGE